MAHVRLRRPALGVRIERVDVLEAGVLRAQLARIGEVAAGHEDLPVGQEGRPGAEEVDRVTVLVARRRHLLERAVAGIPQVGGGALGVRVRPVVGAVWVAEPEDLAGRQHHGVDREPRRDLDAVGVPVPDDVARLGRRKARRGGRAARRSAHRPPPLRVALEAPQAGVLGRVLGAEERGLGGAQLLLAQARERRPVGARGRGERQSGQRHCHQRMHRESERHETATAIVPTDSGAPIGRWSETGRVLHA